MRPRTHGGMMLSPSADPADLPRTTSLAVAVVSGHGTRPIRLQSTGMLHLPPGQHGTRRRHRHAPGADPLMSAAHPAVEAAAGQEAPFELGAGTGVATPCTVLTAVHRTSLPSATGPRIERTGHCRGVVRRSRGPRGPPALFGCGHCAARAGQHTTAAAVIKGGRSGRHSVAARRPTST